MHWRRRGPPPLLASSSRRFQRENTLSKSKKWWDGAKDSEVFWLEVTTRTDLGANLKAPQTNEKGSEFWSCSFLKEVQAGDVVFHYDASAHAVVASSVASSDFWEDDIVWAARGVFARNAGVQPYTRFGYYVGLESYSELDAPLTLQQIRERTADIRIELDQLKAAHPGSLYFPFEDGSTRPIRPLQGYLFKLPRFFVDMFSLTRSAGIGSSGLGKRSQVGSDYRRADESASVAQRDPFLVDPALVERASRAHAFTQNALADYVFELGFTPASPNADDPNYDLAWQTTTGWWVAEVKSLSSSNEEKQLRLGLGQVLRYQDTLKRHQALPVGAVLMVEREPTDSTWLNLCEGLGVLLLWPDRLNDVLGGGRENAL